MAHTQLVKSCYSLLLMKIDYSRERSKHAELCLYLNKILQVYLSDL